MRYLQTAVEHNVMKGKMKIFCVITAIIFLLYGCVGKSPSINPLSSITLENRELQIPEPILYIAEESFLEAIIKEENINLVEAPFEENYFRCGGVYPAEQDTAELLRNAKTVLVLKGSYEKWTPIEGKAKKYLVFKLQ